MDRVSTSWTPGSVRIGLSTSCTYPEGSASAFERAARLGYDGVEVMVGLDAVSVDEDAVERLRDQHRVPVLSVHAPCLVFTQRTWGTDPWGKLRRSAVAARRFGADVVVVHPPFRWQRQYAGTFVAGVRRLYEETGIKFCVENMYPWRAPDTTGGRRFKAYQPGFDPTEHDFEHLTLDLSHASTAHQQSLDLARAWGTRLQHVHLTDGRGSLKDEHLPPGAGDQQADQVLGHLTDSGYAGHVVLEVNTRRAKTSADRDKVLADSLAFTRRHLARRGPSGTVGDRG